MTAGAPTGRRVRAGAVPLLLALPLGFLLGRLLREGPPPAEVPPSPGGPPVAGAAAGPGPEEARLREENGVLRARAEALAAAAAEPARPPGEEPARPRVDRLETPVRVAEATLDPGTGTIRVLCTGPGGRPVGGRGISVLRWGGEPTVRSTDARGIAEFPGLPPGPCSVAAGRLGGEGTTVAAIRPGRVVEVSVAVGVVSVVEGRVAHASKGPLEGIRVALHRSDGAGGGQVGAVTDAEGRYRLDEVPEGRWTVRLQGDVVGFTRQSWGEIAVEGGQPVTRDFLVGAKGLSGTVRERGTGRPLPGVLVQIHSGGPFRMTETDPEGRYAISDVAPGTYGVSFQREGHASESAAGVRVDAEGREHDVEMVPAGTLVLLVTDASGRPLPGDLDLAWGPADREGPLPWATSARADGTGRVVHRRLAPGGYRMEVRAPGGTRRTVEFRLPEGEITVEVRLE